MAEKVTMMVIKVDLQCDRCYRKIRKVLCGFPEIRDQVYDEKQNTVKITVVSCCPDRIKKKICSKGGESVEKIEIVSGDKKKEPEKKKEGGDKAKDGAAGGEKKKEEPEKKAGKEGEPKKKEGGNGKEGEPKKKEGGKEGEKGPAKEPEKKKEGGDKPKAKEPEMKPKQPMPVPVAGYPSIFPPVYPVQAYYDPYQQHQVAVGGPGPCHCQQCHGNMPGYYGARDANRGGYNGGQYDYFSEENPSGCSVM